MHHEAIAHLDYPKPSPVVVDNDGRALTAQLRMSRDVPGDGFYLSGLSSFASRTCYANSSGDHLVRPKTIAGQCPDCSIEPSPSCMSAVKSCVPAQTVEELR